jgi:anti-sigma factor RsiW
MNCTEFRAVLHPYVDGEMTAGQIGAADAHAAECRRCEELARQERDFRQLLRRQPREPAGAELRTRLHRRLGRDTRRSLVRPWLVAPAFAAAAAVLIAVLLPVMRPPPHLVGDLVDKHAAFAQLARPAEFSSGNPEEVVVWFRERAGMRVTVPDYSAAGIQLIGARLTDAHQRQAAYLLYEKGRTLLSVFMVPVGPEHPERSTGSRVSYRGRDYHTRELRGYRTVSWTDGRTLFGLVSTLDYDALLECADRLRSDRENLVSL